MANNSLFAIVAVLIVSGCETVSVAPYTPSPDNVQILRKRLGSGLAPIVLGPVTAASTIPPINCRGAILDVTQGRSFEEYFRDAIAQEILLAGNDNRDGQRIDLVLTDISMNSLDNAHWHLAATVKPKGRSPFDVSYDHRFQSSFIGSSACPMAGSAFGLAARNLIGKIFSDPRLG